MTWDLRPGDLERALIEAWPGDTEFVILRKTDWEKVRFLVDDLIGVKDTVLDGVMLLPVVLDLPEEEAEEAGSQI